MDDIVKEGFKVDGWRGKIPGSFGGPKGGKLPGKIRVERLGTVFKIQALSGFFDSAPFTLDGTCCGGAALRMTVV